MSDGAQDASRARRVEERLYELLPAFVRYRDQSDPADSPLRALMAVLERQFAALERDIDGLYDDWFVETCQHWIAPYLGDLVGVRGLDSPDAWVAGQRTRIANALAYRRLKGTVPVLERVARDVTGWPCVASPFFAKLARCQSLEAVRAGRGATVDVRDRSALARMGGPFDPLARRPRIGGAPGLAPLDGPGAGYDLAGVGLYFWRLQSYPARGRSARRVAPGCYTFNPLGIDQPLFNAWRSGGELTEATAEKDVPGPITRAVLAEELDCRRRGAACATAFLGASPALEIVDPRTGAPVPWRSIRVADLGEWRRPDAAVPRPSAPGERVVVALDPERGRLAFATDFPAVAEVEVSYHYALQGDVGGGPYDRAATVPGDAHAGPASAAAPRAAPADGEARFRSLQGALQARPADAGEAVIELVDSATYGGLRGFDLEIDLRAGASLTIGAAAGESPCIIGNLRIVVGPGAGHARLTLDGVTVGGKVVFAAAAGEGAGPARRCTLDVRDCTLMAPDRALDRDGAGGGIELDADAAGQLDLTVRARSSILGPVVIRSGCGRLQALECIVDGGSGFAIAGAAGAAVPGCASELTRCTILGRVSAARLVAEDSIFGDPVTVAAPRVSRLRYCYVPPGSAAGALEHCQPADGRSLAPVFTSRRHGAPGYAQLSRRCPREISAGASGGSEMGVFCALGHPFREANLASILDEHLPSRLEARVFHVT